MAEDEGRFPGFPGFPALPSFHGALYKLSIAL
jgi:hypothetical protein